MKKYITPIIFAVIFLIGLALFLYPFISNLNNDYLNSQIIEKYNDLEDKLSDDESKKLLEDARLYNENLHNKNKLDELGLEYEKLLNPSGDSVMGTIEIPKIRVYLPIYHTLDDGNLQTGVGHKEDSALPVGGDGTHCVLAGHTGLTTAKLLTNLDRLKNDDYFYIHVFGETLCYRVDNIAVVRPTETSLLQAERGKDYLTIVTCTPYGINSHRLLVRGVRVNNDKKIDPNGAFYVPNDIEFIKPVYLITLCIITAVVLFVVIKIICNKAIKKRKGSKALEENTNLDENINPENQ